MSRISSFFRDVGAVFQTPFAGLPIVLWCYFVVCYMALPHNPIWRGDLPDPDDYTYLSQTLDWLQGQGWFDNVQHRMNAPEGVSIHYTRLAELPIAGVTMLFRLFHYSWRGAALLASFVVPLVYLGAFFAALKVATARLVPMQWAGLSSFVVLFAPSLMFKFAPGQVDHHGLEAVLVITAVGFALQLFQSQEKSRWGLLSGIVFAVALSIALEVLPWMALVSACMGLWGLVVGAKAARGVVLYGLGLFGGSVVALLLEKPTAQIFQFDLLAYSFAYVLLTAGIATGLFFVAALSRVESIKVRLVVGTFAACVLGGIYLSFFPALLAGPYGAMDKQLAALFFSNLEEAVPLTQRYHLFAGMLRLATPVIGFGGCLLLGREASPEKRWGWGLLAALLVAAICLTLFYQIRVLIYAQLFSIIPLTGLVAAGWDWIGVHCRGRGRFWAEIALVLAVGPLTALFLPALQDGRSFNTGVLLFPAQSFDDSCVMHNLEAVLNAPPYAGRKLRIVNFLTEGSELVFYTPHEVMSAPYHTNVRGNLVAHEFFSATDAAQAKQIAQRDGINLVALCRNVPDMYLQGNGAHYVVSSGGEVRMLPNASLAGQLAQHNVPDWLKEVPVPQPSNNLLFEVK